VVNDGRLKEEEAVRDGALPGDVAAGSSSKVLLHLKRKTVVQFIGLNGNGGGRWWRSTVSRAAGVSAEVERRARGRVSTRGENGGGFSMAHPRTKIRPAKACGAAASMTAGGRFGNAQRCERSHHSVTGSVVGGTGLITGQGR
jgi:hypothetical protein